MCGIAGLIAPVGQIPDSGVMDRLADSLAHRGPDGRGRYVRDNVALLQNRLSIIDLEGGRQPILDAQGRAIIANGEVYNYLELRGQLDGATFTTQSDCEPPLHLYARDGLDFAKVLRGMYALAIHDPLENRVVLARDPFGIKPLYLTQGPWGIAFASEPHALIKAGLVPAMVDPQARAEVLQLQFTCSDATIYPGISRVPAGATLVIENGQIRQYAHRPALVAGGTQAGDADSLLDQLDRVLTESVDLHQRSDVPYGMFLSGGIDSSVLLALMARLNARPVLAFTAGFSGTGVHDERDHARALAGSVGADHVEVDFGDGDFWTLLPRVAAAMDDPAADYACLPTYKLAMRARRQVKVILSGEGGDELFGGYGRYRGAMRPWPLSKPMRRNGTFDGLGVLRPLPGWRDRFALAEKAAALPGRSRLQAAQAIDCTDWLANDLLIKADRCLMANAIEGRVPFLDPVVAEFAFTLPDRFKIRNGLGKHLLRLWLERAMPAARPFDKKRGFTVPVGEWIGARREIGALVAAQAGIGEIALPGQVEKLFAAATPKTGFARWSLLFYALWHQIHILGAPADGDAFDTLSTR